MKPTELRIGNLILSKGKIHKVDLGVFQKTERTPFEKYYQPIPLTEEWLLKFGFKYESIHFVNKNGYCKSGDNYSIQLSINKDCFRFHNPHFNLEIKHVHQLQNLYFALTNKELTI